MHFGDSVLLLQYVISQDGNMKFRYINVENSLSSNTVWSIVQDNDGFMWFRTNNVLSKYDEIIFLYIGANPRTPFFYQIAGL